ncbi:MAG: Hpt domain-containing protein [Chloroflexota bacterium]
MADLVDRFLDAAPGRVARIAAGLADGDRADAAQAAAELAGAAAALGATDLADLAAGLEATLDGPDDAAAGSTLAATRDALDALGGLLRDARAGGWPPD